MKTIIFNIFKVRQMYSFFHFKKRTEPNINHISSWKKFYFILIQEQKNSFLEHQFMSEHFCWTKTCHFSNGRNLPNYCGPVYIIPYRSTVKSVVTFDECPNVIIQSSCQIRNVQTACKFIRRTNIDLAPRDDLCALIERARQGDINLPGLNFARCWFSSVWSSAPLWYGIIR